MFRSILLVVGFILATAVLNGCTSAGKPANTPQATPAYTPGLGEIMTLQQMRHVKLWLAGQNHNWDLASYELDELNEGFEDAATYHPTHKDSDLPIPELIDKIMKQPISQVDQAIKAQDADAFSKAFDAVTDGCNRCHQATKFGFNVVTRPSGNPYTNQAFEPAQGAH